MCAGAVVVEVGLLAASSCHVGFGCVPDYALWKPKHAKSGNLKSSSAEYDVAHKELVS